MSEDAPTIDAVIVPAEKLPEASLLTAVLAMFADWKVMLPAFHAVLPLIDKPSALTT